MAWIESHEHLRDHPKVLKMARSLGISKACAIGHLHMLWWWALNYAPSGIVDHFGADDIAIGAEWEGDAATFYRALCHAGFIESDEAGRGVIHDWHDYAGKLIRRREDNRARMQAARAEHVQRTKGTRAQHVQNTCNARAEQVRNTCEATVPYPTVPTPPYPPLAGDLAKACAAFLAAYPRKTGTGAAEDEWRRLNPDGALRETIMAALERHKRSPDWTKEGGKYIPAPAKWLGERRWLDEPLTQAPAETKEARMLRGIG